MEPLFTRCLASHPQWPSHSLCPAWLSQFPVKGSLWAGPWDQHLVDMTLSRLWESASLSLSLKQGYQWHSAVKCLERCGQLSVTWALFTPITTVFVILCISSSRLSALRLTGYGILALFIRMDRRWWLGVQKISFDLCEHLYSPKYARSHSWVSTQWYLKNSGMGLDVKECWFFSLFVCFDWKDFSAVRVLP